jgi:ribose 1,5-bisphosphokinase
MRGRIFALLGPSGVGKDTLLAGVCGDGGPHWVRRVITRPSALGGEPYEGVTDTIFVAREAAGDFALVWRAHGLAYGVPWAELALRDTGRDVVFNGSRAALLDAVGRFPDLGIIHVTAPEAVLRSRLRARGREGAEDIAARLTREVEALPIGLPVIEISNDGTPAQGIARLRAALQPVRGA